jgi:ClpP class serine protease
MKCHPVSVFALILAAVLTATAAAQSVVVRLRDGTRYRGAVGDAVSLVVRERGIDVPYTGRLLATAEHSITVECLVAGRLAQMTFFTGDLVSMTRTDSAAVPAKPAAPGTTAAPSTPSKPGGDNSPASAAARTSDRGVIVLPLTGIVGLEFRHEEIDLVEKEADRLGPGQVIVLVIDSPGGAMNEMETISNKLLRLKEKHRIVGWVRKAISAACATVLHCDEVYFTTSGSAGAMTAFNMVQGALKDEELQRWLDAASRIAEAGGHSPEIARAMIHAPLMVSYDRDPVTGQVTFYEDLSGEFDLSDEKTNLVLTSSEAAKCGFADGIADTEEELARLLDMPTWVEKSDVGRKASEKWLATVKRANEKLPFLVSQLNYKGTGSGDPVVIIGTRIQLLEEIIRWWERAPNACMLAPMSIGVGVPQKDACEREVAELRKQLADMKRGGG